MSSSAVRHLVIFGCGYVGSALAEAALARGMRVTALTRNAEKAAALRARGVAVVEADLASAEWHTRIERADFAANTVSAAAPTPEGYRASYVDGMRSILAWASRAPVGTLVYTSSTGVYPQGGGARVDESAPTESASPTGRVLVEAENLLRGASAATAARSFVLRCAGIYGPGRHYLLNALRAGQTRFGGEPGCRMNLIHRDDIVAALLACFMAPAEAASAVFNLSDGAPATRAEVVGWLASAIGAPEPQFDGAAASARQGGEPTPDRIIVADKIRHALGWAPVFPDFRAGYGSLLGKL
ncbi:MAG: NAD-dependent epimerase/dehydratase family protein [Candidatus Didemnitutus sp.]|nr:NAD-dependent epimerase/dehydratase family protein [Candidatus Didemnitutus sp.]